MISKRFNIQKLLAFSFLSIFLGCSTSPTGRKQLKLLPDSTMQKMGVSAFQDMKQKIPIENNTATVKYVKCVAEKMLSIAPNETGVKEWEIVVFKDPSANAFALPGGRIGVHTGLLAVAQNQDQLAAVIGHEIGHVMARHGNERASQQMVAQSGLVAASIITEDSPKGRMMMAALGVGTQVGVLLPFGRKQESESDYIGLELMSKAGFKPEESIKLWQNMDKASGGKQPPEFLSTHPGHETRIANLKKWQSEAQQWVKEANQAGRSPECNKFL